MVQNVRLIDNECHVVRCEFDGRTRNHVGVDQHMQSYNKSLCSSSL